MRHRRHYTLEEARAALPWVAERLAAMRAARERLTDAEAREALAASARAGQWIEVPAAVGERR
jgi:hypothetical protein